jgi:hypothetical protein
MRWMYVAGALLVGTMAPARAEPCAALLAQVAAMLRDDPVLQHWTLHVSSALLGTRMTPEQRQAVVASLQAPPPEVMTRLAASVRAHVPEAECRRLHESLAARSAAMTIEELNEVSRQMGWPEAPPIIRH